MGSDEKQVNVQRYMPGLAPGIREALDWVFQEYGIGSGRVTAAEVRQGVRGPASITITTFVEERAPELLREQASRLLTVADEREQRLRQEHEERLRLEQERDDERRARGLIE